MANEQITTTATTREAQVVTAPGVVYVQPAIPSTVTMRYVVVGHPPTPRK